MARQPAKSARPQRHTDAAFNPSEERRFLSDEPTEHSKETVKSEWVYNAEYLDGIGALEIETKDKQGHRTGKIYRAYVTFEEAASFARAPSKGTWLHQYIITPGRPFPRVR